MAYWLFKTEPGEFSIDDFEHSPNQVEPWTGIRNYQVRNFIRDKMEVGDEVLIYHSSCKQPGIYGVAEIVSDAYPDPLQFDPDSGYYDPKSLPDDPRWLARDVKYITHLQEPLLLKSIKEGTMTLDDFLLLKKGNRLSIFEVSALTWQTLAVHYQLQKKI